jgi:hypothetical protein
MLAISRSLRMPWYRWTSSIAPPNIDGWLRLNGIRVSVSDASTAEAASARLAALPTSGPGLPAGSETLGVSFRPMGS